MFAVPPSRAGRRDLSTEVSRHARERLSALAALPDDVVDPLLWRLATDVAAAHQPDKHGNCRNLQCAGKHGMCAAARSALRVTNHAHRPCSTSFAWVEAGARPCRCHRPLAFRSCFFTTPTQPEVGLSSRQPPASSVAVRAA